MSEMANSLGITMSGCTALVDQVVKAGWVERQRDPNDRRVVLVDVSPAGKQMLTQIREMRARILARYLTRLNPDEIVTLTELLERTAAAIDPIPEAAVAS
jgi:DNA-binding MarR family transcriptional regulator